MRKVILCAAFLCVSVLGLAGLVDAAQKTCEQNVRRIGMAMLMYTLDNDEMLPHRPSAYRGAVTPYVVKTFKSSPAASSDKRTTAEKVRTTFHCPADKSASDSYAMNDTGRELPLAAVEFPEKMIMAYEGKKAKLALRHDGRGHLITLDGKVKLANEGSRYPELGAVQRLQATAWPLISPSAASTETHKRGARCRSQQT